MHTSAVCISAVTNNIGRVAYIKASLPNVAFILPSFPGTLFDSMLQFPKPELFFGACLKEEGLAKGKAALTYKG